MRSDQGFLLQAIVDNFPGGISVMDSDLRVIFANHTMRQILDLPDSLFAGGPPLLEELFRFNAGRRDYGPGDIEKLVAERMALAKARKPHEFERRRPDGTTVEVRGVPVEGGGFVTTYVDITERRRSEARIEHMAHHDALTGLPNRVLFYQRLDEALARIARSGNLAVLCLDLDHFKSVNDTLGHPIGDLLLKTVAKRLSKCLRKTDIVARLGGDEFAIIMSTIDGAHDAEGLASKLIDVVGSTYEIQGHEIIVGVSVGIAIAPGDGVAADALLRNADMALYRAKADGRGRFHFFEPEMNRRVQLRRILELELRKAFSKDEFELYYQPVVNLQSGDVSGFEALLHWHHPERGMVLPADFIPLAEEIGLIIPLGEWILRKACAEAMTWPLPLKVAVNLSPVQFKSRNLVQAVITSLAYSRLPAERLELEITESVLLGESDANLVTLHQLRALGVHISMDGFGTGYSSLSYLRSFPFDKIKIDQSFVRELAERPDCLAIIHAVAGLGTSLGITTTAEGVETQEQFDRLRAEGCVEMQGFLFSPPRPASEIAMLLLRKIPMAKVA